jgi:hypothetical protein
MGLADRRYQRIVNLRARDFAIGQDFPKILPVHGRLPDQTERRGLQPDLDLRNGNLDRSRKFENPVIRDDSEELMHARPGNGPMLGVFRKTADGVPRALKEFGIAPVGIYQDVGVDGDHAPRPW